MECLVETAYDPSMMQGGYHGAHWALAPSIQ